MALEVKEDTTPKHFFFSSLVETWLPLHSLDSSWMSCQSPLLSWSPSQSLQPSVFLDVMNVTSDS